MEGTLASEKEARKIETESKTIVLDVKTATLGQSLTALLRAMWCLRAKNSQ
jgi:hypothetical protein